MIGLLTVLGALLLGVRAQQQEFGLVGSDVTLVPKYTGDLKEITWTMNDILLVEFVLKPRELFIYHLTNDRTTVNKTNGALTIRYLTTGDSGVYKAQVVLMDDSVQVTKIRLTVHDCPDQPTISVQSTKDQFVVSCKSFSPDVTYEWFNPTTSVSKNQSYAEPKKSGTLTCVVDNEVCNKSSSINFYIPEEKSSGYNVTLVPKYTGDPSEIIWKVNGYKLVKMMLKPQVDRKFYRLEDRATISDTDGSLTIRGLTMEDSGDYTAVVLVNNDYYYTEIRLESWGLSVWSITGIVSGVLAFNSIINFLPLLYFYFKKSRHPSGGDIALIVIGVLSLITIINFILFLWYYYKSIHRCGGDIFLIVVAGVLLPITILCSILLLWHRCYKKSSRLSGWSITGIVILIPILPILITIILLWYYYYKKKKIEELSTRPEMRIYTSKVAEVKREEGKKICREEDSTPHKMTIYTSKVAEVKREKGKKNWQAEDSTPLEMTIYTSKDSDIKRAEESERCITVSWKDDTRDESRGHLDSKRIQSPRLTIHGVQAVDHGIFTAEAVMSDKKKGSFTDGTETSVRIDLWAGRKKLYNPNTEIHVKELVWKKDGVTQFKWAISSLKFLTSNIKLKRESVTVYDAEGKKSYKVYFRLEEPPESKSICCITFHPSKMTNIDQNTWKKDSQPVNIGNDRIKCDPNGDLTMYNATSEDKGKYTVQCIDKKLDQEFILHL